LGPGLITGASDDDPSGIATYSQAGAQFGFFYFMDSITHFSFNGSHSRNMCKNRFGYFTGFDSNHKATLFQTIAYLMLFSSFPAITLNIGADIQGMGAVANMISLQYLFSVFCVGFTSVLMFCNHKISISKNSNDFKVALSIAIALYDCSIYG